MGQTTQSSAWDQMRVAAIGSVGWASDPTLDPQGWGNTAVWKILTPECVLHGPAMLGWDCFLEIFFHICAVTSQDNGDWCSS